MISLKLKRIQSKFTPIFQKYPIKKAGLFGSIVRDEDKADSDIDVLIDFLPDARLSLFDIVGIQQNLEDVIGREVDLVQYKTIKPALRKFILPNEVRIYEKTVKHYLDDFGLFEVKFLKTYFVLTL